ncbi:ELO family [Kalaharituber pfeilii]|nr:ELO family [Kalaharituber pfeilii]
MSSVRLTAPPSPLTLLDFAAYDPAPPINPSSIPTQLYNALLHPAVPLTIATVYATTVHYFNSLSDGTPYRISKTKAFKYGVILHNLGLAAYSLWTFIGMSQILHKTIIHPHLLSGAGSAFLGFVDSMCKIQDRAGSASAAGLPQAYSNFSSQVSTGSGSAHLHFDVSGTGLARPGLWSAGLGYYGWIFYLSKFYEVVDTMIIILKGRKSSTLQTYHHAGAMLSMWAGIRWMSPPIWIFCWYNSGIHTLMYTYYTLSALSIRVPNAIKRSLTSMQITQFLVGGSTAASYLFIKYRASSDGEYVKCLSTLGEELAVIINVAYLTPLTYLFVRFFIRSYIRGGKSASAGKSAKEAGKAVGKVEGRSSGVEAGSSNGAVKRS